MAKLEWRAETSGGVASGEVEVSPGCGVVRVVADVPAGALCRVEAHMSWPVEAGERIYMNGYQTWTCSPELARTGKLHNIDRVPRGLIDKYAFDRYGDYHFTSYGHHAGQSHGFSYGYFRAGARFRLVASLDETPGYTQLRYDARTAGGRLSFERDCAGVEHAGGSFHVFDLFFAEGGEDEVFDAWFAAMGCAPRTREKLAGYSSWYNRYQDIDETAIRQDLAGCRSLFRAGDLFQIDDGWEPKVGDWLEPDGRKFAGGLAPLAAEIHAAGFKAGLWLAPFVCERSSKLYREHPDWLLRVDPARAERQRGSSVPLWPGVLPVGGDAAGEPWRLGSNWSGFYSLDIDNPEVVDYVRRVFDRVIGEWGFDLVKLDFLYGAAPFGTPAESRAARMRRAMELLRECVGDALILGCGVPVAPAFGLVDYCRVSCDVTLDWDDVAYMRGLHRERSSTRQAISNTLTRRELNGRAYGSDPDVFFLRRGNCRLNQREKDQLACVNALLGDVMLTSDDPGEYSTAIRELYNQYRDIFENACDVQVDLDAGEIRYKLHDKPQRLKLMV